MYKIRPFECLSRDQELITNIMTVLYLRHKFQLCQRFKQIVNNTVAYKIGDRMKSIKVKTFLYEFFFLQLQFFFVTKPNSFFSLLNQTLFFLLNTYNLPFFFSNISFDIFFFSTLLKYFLNIFFFLQCQNDQKNNENL